MSDQRNPDPDPTAAEAEAPEAAAEPVAAAEANADGSESAASGADETEPEEAGPLPGDDLPGLEAPVDHVPEPEAPVEPAAEPAPLQLVPAEVPPDEEALRVAEALVFASAAPVLPRALSQILPMGMDPDAVIAALPARAAGRGVELVDAAGGVQFRTAQDVAPKLRKVIEVPRRLPRVAMETLAIIAYHQPVTRAEIEEIRGASLSQQTLDALLEANLVVPKGRRESPGRPTLWGTTPQFLTQFGLQDIRDLPRRDDLLVEPPLPVKPEAPPAEASAAEPAPNVPGEDGQEAGPGGDDHVRGTSEGG